MIKIKTIRDDKDSGIVKNLGERNESVTKALELLVLYELGYGGVVTDFSSSKVVVETDILSGAIKDTTIFEGSKEEMKLLLRIAACHTALINFETSRNAVFGKAIDVLETLPNGIGNVPFYISLISPFLIGGSFSSFALLFAMGVTDPDTIKTLTSIRLEDLVAAAQLSLENGLPLPEIAKEMNLVAT
jgi:hypothetical protein